MLKLTIPEHLLAKTTEPTFACDQCRDTGWETIRRVDEQVDRLQRCTGGMVGSCGWQDQQRGAAPGVPSDEAGSTLDGYTRTADNSEALVQAQYFLDGIHPGLYLHGTVGSGKTKLACTLLNLLWKRGKIVRFKRCPELLLQLQPRGGDEDQDRELVFQQMTTTPVLCLDDVGASQASDFARRMLQTIYDARLDRGHRTIWTSNLNLDELGEFLGDDRLPSRIAGSCRVVEISGRDWRLKRRPPARPSK